MTKETMRTSTASRHVNWRARTRSNQFMMLPLRGVVGCRLGARCALSKTITRRSRNQPTTDNARAARSSASLDRHPHFQKIDRRAHVMDSYDRRAGALGRGDGGERSEGAVGTGRASGEMADERFARGAD